MTDTLLDIFHIRFFGDGDAYMRPTHPDAADEVDVHLNCEGRTTNEPHLRWP